MVIRLVDRLVSGLLRQNMAAVVQSTTGFLVPQLTKAQESNTEKVNSQNMLKGGK
jgi:hypothetical protein